MNRGKVSLKADAGNAFPAVDYTWFVDSEKKAEGQICDFEVNALDNINTVATGILVLTRVRDFIRVVVIFQMYFQHLFSYCQLTTW